MATSTTTSNKGRRQLAATATAGMKFVQVKSSTSTLLEWLPLPDDYDYLREIGRAAFADMLHDHDRNKKYERGISRAVAVVIASGREPRVLDIGTGTGLLSIFAARAGAKHITAIDSFPPMINIAKKVLARNGVPQEVITLINARSTDLTALPSGHKANILITEVFDTELIGEGAIATYNHAITHLLEPNFLAVPDSATIHLLLGTSPTITNFNTLQCSLPHPPNIGPISRTCHGENSAHDLHATHAIKDFALKHHLTPFKFQFTELLPSLRTSPLPPRDDDDPTSPCYTAAVLYWTLQMTPDDDSTADNTISCAPNWIDGSAPFREHWIQAAYYIPPPPTTTTTPPKITHDEFSFFFTDSGTPPTCTCPSRIHAHLSRNRLAQLNSTNFPKLTSSIPTHLKTIIVISDHTPLPSLLPLSHPQSSILSLSPNSANVLSPTPPTNTIPPTTQITSPVGVTFFSPHFTSSFTPLDDFNTLTAQLNSLQHAHPQLKLNLFPPSVKLVLLGITLVDPLDRIRAPVVQTCAVDLSDFDALLEPTLATLNEQEAHPLHEYSFRTNNHSVIDILLMGQPTTHSFTPTGNALAYWINWGDTGDDGDDILTPPPNRSHGLVFICDDAEFTVTQTTQSIHINKTDTPFLLH